MADQETERREQCETGQIGRGEAIVGLQAGAQEGIGRFGRVSIHQGRTAAHCVL